MKCKMSFIIKIVKLYIYVKTRINFFLYLNAFILIIDSRLMFDLMFNFFFMFEIIVFSLLNIMRFIMLV